MYKIISFTFLCSVVLGSSAAFAESVGQLDRADRDAAGNLIVAQIPPDFPKEIGDLYPESVTQTPQAAEGPNLLVTEDNAGVTVVFAGENASLRNLFGYFVYSVDTAGNITITDRQLIFPNVAFSDHTIAWGDFGGAGELVPGLQATLRDGNGNIRRFKRGDRIGFFIITDGWRTSMYAGGPDTGPAAPYEWPTYHGVALPSADPAQNFNDSEGVLALTTLDPINPEVARGHPEVSRHARALRHDPIAGLFGGRQFWIFGLEDLDRSTYTYSPRFGGGLASDSDFNEMVWLVEGPVQLTAEPPQDTNCVDDAFPDDPWRCSLETASGTLIYEDNYPFIGDADYDDVVLSYTCKEARNVANAVTDIECTYNLYASGAIFEHDFGVAIDNIPSDTTGEVRIEYFPSFTGATPVAAPPPYGFSAALADYVVPTPDPRDAPDNSSIRLRHLFHSTRNAFHDGCDGYGGPESFYNTFPQGTRCRSAAVRVLIGFDKPIPDTVIAQAPYDPFIEIPYLAGPYDIHLPGVAISFAGTQDFPAIPAGGEDEVNQRPEDLDPYNEYRFLQAIEGNENQTFFYPWALHIPTQSIWKYAQERHALGFRYTPAPLSGATPVAFNAYPEFDTWVDSRGRTDTTWYLTPDLSNVIADPETHYFSNQPWTIGFGVENGIRRCTDTSPSDGRCD